ncbi:MAG: ParB N-terminal domain-containing protein [Thermoplasmata archaeon]
MSRPPAFEILPIDRLHAHEATDPSAVANLRGEMLRTGVFAEPIWVARGSYVILNGHHRWEALRALGGRRIPAWVFDYLEDEEIRLDRWNAGPPISKSEVVRAAVQGRRFPIKTTRHRLAHSLPTRSTPLTELFDGPVPDAALPKGRSRAASQT